MVSPFRHTPVREVARRAEAACVVAGRMCEGTGTILVPRPGALARADPMRLIFCLALLSLLLAAPPGPAPPRSAGGDVPADLDTSRAVTQYASDSWGMDDGLPMSVVETLARTADGHIWVGTQEGLARFDGVTFTPLDSRGASGLPDNAVMALAPDASGGLWVGTRDGGLAHVDRDLQVAVYDSSAGLPGMTVAALAVDSAGRVWAGTRGGLCRLDPAAAHPQFTCTEAGLEDPYVRELARGRDGTLWLGTRAGLFRFAHGHMTSLAGLGGAAVEPTTALAEDASGGLWVGTLGGLGYLDRGTMTVPPGAEALAGTTVSSLLAGPAGALWAGTDGAGLVRIVGDAAEALAETGGASVKTVRALLSDPEGSLWVGTSGGGLVRLRDGRFLPIGAPEGLGGDAVYAVAADPTGGVWAATSGGGAAHIEGGRVVRRLTTADGMPSNDVSTVLATRDGSVWAGFAGDGLCRWQSNRTTCFGEADGLPAPYVIVLFEDTDGTLWAGTDGGLVRWTGRGFAPPAAEDAPAAPVVSLARTADGALWAGTFGDGLYSLAPGGARFTHRPDLAGDVVLALHARPDGTLWAGTDGAGLVRIQTGPGGWAEAHRFTTHDGLLSNSVLQVLEDGQHRLWLTTNRGITRLAISDLDRAARGDSSATLTPVVYGRPDGLRSAEANGGVQPAGVATADGTLWFPTTAGVAAIDPAAIPTNRVVPPVVVQQMTVNGESVLLAEAPLVLAAGSRELAFEYAGLSFLAPGRVRHRYRLAGRDDGWTEAGDRRTAFYTDLAPGDYVFEVQAANDDGVWNRTGADVAFTLRPHVWQTGWFAVLCALVALALAAFAVHTRTRQLRTRAEHLEQVVDERTGELRVAIAEVQQQKDVIEEQAESLVRLDEAKTLFFNNVSHEFRTPLTLTIGPLENALDDAYGPVSGPLRRQMEMMLRNSRRLLRLINQLLDVAKLESGKMALKARRSDVRALLEMVTRSFEGFAEEHRIALVLDAPSRPVALTFEADKIEKVFFNLLSNAVKYTPAGGTITVRVEETEPGEGCPEGAVVVRVEDTGRGMEAEALPHIFDRFHQSAGSDSVVQASTGIGLSLVRELVELHAGTIAVESTLGVGSAFVVTLPRGEAHLGPDDLDTEYDAADARPDANATAAIELAKVRTDYRDRKDGQAAGYSNDGAATYGDGTALTDDAELVLLVEDNPDVRAYVRDCLADRYRIAEAPDGQQGLDAARRLRPDLVLSDVMMPVMDGYALCRALKADKEIGHTPLILLTAKADESQRVAGLELGADDYMAKPFNARELRARVHNTLLIKRQERELAELNEDLRVKVCEQVEDIFRKSRLQKYFPQKLVRQILDGDAEVTVGAGRKRITVFFSDLTGFTTLSDTTPPEVVTQLLNEYLTEMVTLIEVHGGTLDKFMGDGIMVLFGAADDMAPDVQARQAVSMAIAMQHALAGLRQRWASRGLVHRVDLRIGINQDEVTVGNFGSEDLLEYTAIGSGVNLASRLEGACAPGQVLVALPVFALTRDQFAFGGGEAYRLKGLADPVPAYLLDPHTGDPVRLGPEVLGPARMPSATP